MRAKRTIALLLALLLVAGGCSLRLEKAEPSPPAQESFVPAEPDPAPDEPDPVPAEPDPAPPTGEELCAARAQEILDGMTLEEKIGQMFFARRPAGGTAEKMAEYQLDRKSVV